jgi:hypothetical protein
VRGLVVWASVAGASILLFLSILAVWARVQGLDTDRWTATSASLLNDDVVRLEVARYLVAQVIARTELKELVAELERRQGEHSLAEIRAAAVTAVDELLRSPPGRELWKEANRDAHAEFVQLLKHGDKRPVVLDLGELAESLAAEGGVIGRLAGSLAPSAGEVVVLRKSQVGEGQTAARVIESLTVYLPIAAAGLALIALALARGRRRTVLFGLGLGAVAAGVAVIVGRELGGGYVVDGLVRDETARPAVDATWQIGTSLLEDIAIPVVAVGGAVALIAAAWTILRR